MAHNLGFEQLVEQYRSRVQECRVSDVQDRLERGEPFHFMGLLNNSGSEPIKASE